MPIKDTLLKGACPFLLGVVVTVAISALVTPCCKDVLSQQQKEVVDTKKIVQNLHKDVQKQRRSIDRLLKEVSLISAQVVPPPKAAPATKDASTKAAPAAKAVANQPKK